ncbi:MAG: PLP-dependent aminotransferase family protein [Bradyrhizobium sp.]|uniref:aminotransferase-like domain-containing protein n=1 Tax=Bradyrhizobium sp. TaxID=376 RepID=UPI001C29DA9B|nr:PLP-dependent aminotransferase family protein [Bradyrhizobium sp.]MBU6463196.1 PLP-dependent aminotransferase family protein [Pseudomonadota bacterium]MDE2067002.1 PLP-dependent aminotransferase family protein [Bradyrhizobium sp.]MDE2241202.1 PLP-dependent aminotransferase family protein [Bradyrhizobium sp.]MDE2472110.1 PLP-dependent aminotransferase family protein [Bradyrhizobium sp.]
MEWIPTISELDGPLYRRIVDAMESDIGSGRLVRGQQLPTHRALARILGIDLTTVTRAYSEARHRGLIEAQVGRGSFVSETTVRRATESAPEVRIDLSMNVPPHPLEAQLDDRILQGLEAIRQKSGLTAFLNYLQPGGSDSERQTGARWLRARVPHAAAERIVVYPGTQTIIFNLLMRLAGRDDVVLTEALTFPGMKAAAARLGIRLIGVAMDKEGVLPDELKTACRVHKPKAVYLIPTLHNPTTATLSPARRAAVAATIRAAGTILIEDDAYGLLAPSVSPIANLIPERTYLATTLSKCIAPALRVSYLLTPDVAAQEDMCARLQAAAQMPPPLMVALVTHWIESGTAERIIAAIRSEAIGRQQLAARALKGINFSAGRASHHLWLTLPESRREGFTAYLLRNGLAVVGSDAFAMNPDAPHAVRVSLGAARNRAQLVEGLQVMASALRMPSAQRQVV